MRFTFPGEDQTWPRVILSTCASLFQDSHHAARTTHYGSLPQKSQRSQDENPVVHFFKNIVSAGTRGTQGLQSGSLLAAAVPARLVHPQQTQSPPHSVAGFVAPALRGSCPRVPSSKPALLDCVCHHGMAGAGRNSLVSVPLGDV